jgi:tetratricopeptide (TPR) repeat protein
MIQILKKTASPIALCIGDFFYFFNKRQEAKYWYVKYKTIQRNKMSSKTLQRIGAILGSENKLNLAEIYLKKAISIDPCNAEALTNMGQLLYAQKDFKKSRTYLDAALKICPSSYKASHHRAYLNLLEGDIDNALKDCMLSISLKKWKPTLLLLISIYEKNKSNRSAISTIKDLIKLDPTDWKPRLRLGQLLSEDGQANQSIQELILASSVSPNNPEILLELGKSLNLAGNSASAKEYLRDCIKLIREDDTKTVLTGARAHIELKNYQKAILLLDAIVEKSPKNEEALYYKGYSLLQIYNYEDAIACFEKIINDNPLHFGSLANLGQSYYEVGEPRKALFHLEKAASIEPKDAATRWNLSLALLATGEYERGWKEYEWRWKINDVIANDDRTITFNNPPWDGKSNLKESRLVVLPEQGLGDTIQFSRFIPSLQEYAGDKIEVSFFTGPKLHGLINYSNLFSRLCTAEEAINSPNWIPLLSIPRIVGVNNRNSSPCSPYLFAKENEINFWKQNFSSNHKITIGIHWQGRPETEIRGLQGRSFPLSIFGILADDHDDFVFISLQKGHGAEQLDDILFKDRFINCQETVTKKLDFLETAAMVMACDLIITSDSGLAHLSGALGQETWLLLAKNTDWRWGVNQEKTHWYPSLKLFRQSESGNWHDLMHSVSKAFSEWKATKKYS